MLPWATASRWARRSWSFGLHTTLAQNLKMGAVFTLVSIARSFAVRRLFEAIRIG
jgi:hypothetical protein